MSTVSVTIQTLLQGFYSLLWIAVLLCNLLACIAFLAFRERAFRYAAARVRAFVILAAGSTE